MGKLSHASSTMQEQEDAIDKERAAAQSRMRETVERYEQQMQIQRMRLVSDADMRIEQIEMLR